MLALVDRRPTRTRIEYSICGVAGGCWLVGALILSNENMLSKRLRMS
jgi:hypothetical protein